MPGESNNICLHDYYYSLEEIAELLKEKMKGRVIHFASKEILNLTNDEAQYFLVITRRGLFRVYGSTYNKLPVAVLLTKLF